MRKLLSPWREKSYSWGNNEYTDYIIDAIGGQIEIGYVRSAKMSGVFYWGAGSNHGTALWLYDAKTVVEKHLLVEGYEFANEKILLLL